MFYCHFYNHLFLKHILLIEAPSIEGAGSYLRSGHRVDILDIWKACNMPPIRLREGLASPRNVPSTKHEGHPEEKTGLLKSDGRITILFKVRGTGLAVYFPCLPAPS